MPPRLRRPRPRRRQEQHSRVPARELGAFLPRQLLPRLYHHLEELPLNANRKTDRRALGELAAGLL